MMESTPILFQIKSMVRDIILDHLGVHDLHPRSQECPPRVPDGSQICIFSIVKLERSAIHPIVSILKDKSLGALKITYGNHPWSQECHPSIRKALSTTFIIFYYYTHILEQNEEINPNPF